MLTELDFVVFDTDVPIWPTLPYFLITLNSRRAAIRASTVQQVKDKWCYDK